MSYTWTDGEVITAEKLNNASKNEILVITFQIAYPSFEVTCNRTIEEIKTAWDARIPIIGIVLSQVLTATTFCHSVDELTSFPGEYMATFQAYSLVGSQDSYGGYEAEITVDKNGAMLNRLINLSLEGTFNQIY